MKSNTTLLDQVLLALDDLKAGNVTHLDVRDIATFTDDMIIATGNSSRHVLAIAQNLRERMKKDGLANGHIESDSDGEWILVDLGDVVVHVMQPLTRQFYNLERLWSPMPEAQAV